MDQSSHPLWPKPTLLTVRSRLVPRAGGQSGNCRPKSHPFWKGHSCPKAQIHWHRLATDSAAQEMGNRLVMELSFASD